MGKLTTIFIKAVFGNGKKQLAEFTIDISPDVFLKGVSEQYDESDNLVYIGFCSEIEFVSYSLAMRGQFLRNFEREIVEKGLIEIIPPRKILADSNHSDH
jgi:hypothetical protein